MAIVSKYHCDSCGRRGPVGECRVERKRSDDVRVLKTYRCPSCQTLVKAELEPYRPEPVAVAAVPALLASPLGQVGIALLILASFGLVYWLAR